MASLVENERGLLGQGNWKSDVTEMNLMKWVEMKWAYLLHSDKNSRKLKIT